MLPRLSPNELLEAWRQYGATTPGARERAALRLKVLRELQKYLRDGVPLMRARELTACAFHGRGSKAINPASIARWQASVEGQHPADWLALLVPQHAGRAAFARIEPAMWMRFKTDFLRPECPTASSCYARLRRAAQAHGKALPSLKTLMRRLDDEMPTWRQARLNGPRLSQLSLFD